MMRLFVALSTRLLSIGFGLGLSCWAGSVGAGPLDTLEFNLMRPNGIRWTDLDLRAGILDTVPFQLKKVEELLRSPRSAQDLPQEFRRAFHSQSPLTLGDSLLSRKSSKDSLWLNELKAYAKGLTPSQWQVLRQATEKLFRMQPDDTLLDPVSSEKKRLAESFASDSAFVLARHLDESRIVRAGLAAQDLQRRMRDTLLRLGPRKSQIPIREMAQKSGLPFHLATSRSEEHHVENGIWFDPGGDDTWKISGTAKPGQALIILDAAGNDHFLGRDTMPTWTNWGGLLLIDDEAGDDSYEDQGFGFAAGLFGISVLYDAEGNDRYSGGCATQGFGFFGIGMIQDLQGNDSYSASLFAQGAASTRGLGMVLDGQGNDTYTMRPDMIDDLRYRDHFLSMGQGFASGFMQGAAGGIGVLWDGQGHDTYTADIFAQGSGYWHSLGILIDDEGSDRYIAHQYAQGAGVHEAVGLLVDSAGDDRYYSKGVSQGCGHDRGLGWLFDFSGKDLYSATDMSQGAGSANGLGLLTDISGDDAYQALKPNWVLGHGDMRRDRGSYGFFWDGSGIDIYPIEHRNQSGWRVFGSQGRGNGYGLDR